MVTLVLNAYNLNSVHLISTVYNIVKAPKKLYETICLIQKVKNSLIVTKPPLTYI